MRDWAGVLRASGELSGCGSGIHRAGPARASREAGRLIVTGTRVDGAQAVPPPALSPEANARSLRLLILFGCLGAVVGGAVCVIFFLDPDIGTIEWTDRVAIVLLLVMLPLSVAVLSWRVLRRTQP